MLASGSTPGTVRNGKSPTQLPVLGSDGVNQVNDIGLYRGPARPVYARPGAVRCVVA